MMSFFTLIRWKNIIIILLTEIIIKYALIDYFLVSAGLSYRMSDLLFIALALSSIFIAAAGYILNDMQDIEIDRINTNNRPLVKGSISFKTARILMYTFNIVGIIFAFYSSFIIKNPSLASFQLFVMALLYGYSIRFKCSKIIGNIIIALTTAFVPFLIWIYTIYDLLAKSVMFSYEIRWLHLSVVFYMIFAFLTNWIRELIKDKEDSEADMSNSCITWAATTSVKSFKTLIIILLIVLNVFMAWFQLNAEVPNNFKIAFSVLIAIIFVITIPKVIRAKTISHYHNISNTMKGIMLIGLLTPLLLWL